jgi:hypothetical protein
MSAEARHNFDPNIFLSTIGDGRQMISFRKKQIIFAQGDATDAVFVIQKGKQQEKPMSKHDTPTKPHRRPKSKKRIDYSARTMAALRELEQAAKLRIKAA